MRPRLRISNVECQAPAHIARRQQRRHTAFGDPHSAISNPRPALTLVELLVVITILTTLVAAAIPLMAPSSAERRLREGARQLNTMITGAQARAIKLGRPVGIWLERLSVETGRDEDRGAVMNAYYCETPQPFRGFSEDSAVIFKQQGAGWMAQFIRNYIDLDLSDGSNDSYPPEPIPPGVMHPFDRISVDGVEFNLTESSSQKIFQDGPNKGFYGKQNGQVSLLRCALLDPTKEWNDGTFDPPDTSIPSGTWTYPMRYSVNRVPQKSSSDPLQLPDGVVIDLEGSGDSSAFGLPHFGGFYHDPLRPYPVINGGLRQNDNDDPIVIMFGPDGSISRVYRNAGLPISTGDPLSVNYVPISGIHLLISQRENIDESANGTGNDTDFSGSKTNWLNAESIWVSIQPRSGRTGTSENALVDAAAFNPGIYPSSWPSDNEYKRSVFQRHAAREFTRSNFSLGGR